MRILIFDGAPADHQALYVAMGAKTNATLFTDCLRAAEPDVETFALNVADGERLPQGVRLDDFDGVVITGSPLNVYRRQPAVDRQIELAGELFEAGIPVYGSCWGLQVMTAALGGRVRLNPRGREIGIARAITRTPDGAAHPLLAGKGQVFDAICSHEDEAVAEALPPGSTVLAFNDMSAVQALAIERGEASFWGVQYHPEFDLSTVAAIMTRRAEGLAQEGFGRTGDDVLAMARDFETLERDPSRRDLAWRYGLGADVLDADRRSAEIANWLRTKARARAAAR